MAACCQASLCLCVMASCSPLPLSIGVSSSVSLPIPPRCMGRFQQEMKEGNSLMRSGKTITQRSFSPAALQAARLAVAEAPAPLRALIGVIISFGATDSNVEEVFVCFHLWNKQAEETQTCSILTLRLRGDFLFPFLL